MKAKTIHLNPPGASGRARCGVRLARVEHRADVADVTCNTCIRLDALDKADAPPPDESPVSESMAFTEPRAFYTGPKGPLDAHAEEPQP